MKKWFNHVLQGFYWWLECKASNLSQCELCHEETIARQCIGCKAYICYGCDSMYYEDETLCAECRATITPEQEAQDRAECGVESED
jgi:hypothetical protein